MNNKEIFSASNDTSLDLSALGQQLRQNIGFILLITTLSFLTGIIYLANKPPQYQAEILLQIEENKQSHLGLNSFYKKLALSSSNNTVATHAALIQSRFILSPVISTLNLDIQLKPNQGLLTPLLFHYPALSITVKKFETPHDALNQPFSLLISHNRFDLYNSHHQLILTGKVNQLTKNGDFSLLVINRSNGPLSNGSFIITKLSNAQVVQQLQKRLKIKDLGGKDSTGILQVSLQGSSPKKLVQILNTIGLEAQRKNIKKKSLEATKSLGFLYKQLPTIKKDLNQAEYQLNAYRARSGKIDIKLQSQALLTQLEELDKQLSTLKINQVDMLQRYTNKHPFIITQAKQISLLVGKKRALEHQLKQLPASDQITVNLMREVEVKNALYLVLLNKIQELQFIKAGTLSDLRILSMAKLPEFALPNHASFIYLGSLLLGLVLSIALIFLRKALSIKLNDPYWTERHLQVPTLAIIPYCKEQTASRFKKGVSLLAHIDSQNLAIEALRNVRTALQIHLNKKSHAIISILGITPGIGKSFISANLAYLMASGGKKILLIDGDLRKGVLHQCLGLHSQPGLGDYLDSSLPLTQLVQPTMHSNLDFIAKGCVLNNPSEVLMGSDMKDLFSHLVNQYDVIVVDTAPLLLVTDGFLIANLADINYLVVGANHHEPQELLSAFQNLSNVGIRLAGTVFNFFNRSIKQNHSKYYTYYQ